MKTLEDLAKAEPDNSPEAKQENLECLADMEWAMTDPEVRRKYWDQYVAVYQKRVLAHGPDAEKVRDEAEKVSGVPANRIMVVGIAFWD